MYENNQQPNFQQQPNYQQGYVQQAISSFDGGVLGCLGATILSSLMITFTLGIATPWAVAYLYKFILSHVTIDGRRLRFDGTGGQLFGNWIKWFLLTIVTLGIYSFWVTPRLYNWIASHTHRED